MPVLCERFSDSIEDVLKQTAPQGMLKRDGTTFPMPSTTFMVIFSKCKRRWRILDWFEKPTELELN